MASQSPNSSFRREHERSPRSLTRWAFSGWPFLLGLLLAGCGPATVTIKGQVTLDGQPLSKGVIAFIPSDIEGETATATIENGAYTVQTLAGNKRVQISAPVVTGTRKAFDGPGAPTLEITEESLPDRYHASTELTFTAQPGENTKDWSVESKRRKP